MIYGWKFSFAATCERNCKTQFPNVYCKSRIFCENFVFANSIKRHICDAKNSRLGHDLPISVNDRVISAFREDFKFRENIALVKISEFTVSNYIPPQMNILNMVFPILMPFCPCLLYKLYVVVSDQCIGSCAKSHVVNKCNVINNIHPFSTVYCKICCC